MRELDPLGVVQDDGVRNDPRDSNLHSAEDEEEELIDCVKVREAWPRSCIEEQPIEPLAMNRTHEVDGIGAGQNAPVPPLPKPLHNPSSVRWFARFLVNLATLLY